MAKFVTEIIVVIEDGKGNQEFRKLSGAAIMEVNRDLYCTYTIGGKPATVEINIVDATQRCLSGADMALARVQGPPLGAYVLKILEENND